MVRTIVVGGLVLVLVWVPLGGTAEPEPHIQIEIPVAAVQIPASINTTIWHKG